MYVCKWPRLSSTEASLVNSTDLFSQVDVPEHMRASNMPSCLWAIRNKHKLLSLVEHALHSLSVPGLGNLNEMELQGGIGGGGGGGWMGRGGSLSPLHSTCFTSWRSEEAAISGCCACVAMQQTRFFQCHYNHNRFSFSLQNFWGVFTYALTQNISEIPLLGMEFSLVVTKYLVIVSTKLISIFLHLFLSVNTSCSGLLCVAAKIVVFDP